MQACTGNCPPLSLRAVFYVKYEVLMHKWSVCHSSANVVVDGCGIYWSEWFRFNKTNVFCAWSLYINQLNKLNYLLLFLFCLPSETALKNVIACVILSGNNTSNHLFCISTCQNLNHFIHKM